MTMIFFEKQKVPKQARQKSFWINKYGILQHFFRRFFLAYFYFFIFYFQFTFFRKKRPLRARSHANKGCRYQHERQSSHFFATICQQNSKNLSKSSFFHEWGPQKTKKNTTSTNRRNKNTLNSNPISEKYIYEPNDELWAIRFFRFFIYFSHIFPI